MRRIQRRKCRHCGRWFLPDYRHAWHQRFCLEPGCQKASKRVSQQKWCRKNPGYFRGEVHVKRVQDWRRKHPGYWKAKGSAAACGGLDSRIYLAPGVPPLAGVAGVSGPASPALRAWRFFCFSFFRACRASSFCFFCWL